MIIKTRRISEKRFESKLARLLERRLEPIGASVSTYQDARVLTNNRDLVVSLPNEQEFQVTIVESTRR
jgi:hypothetical protein